MQSIVSQSILTCILHTAHWLHGLITVSPCCPKAAKVLGNSSNGWAYEVGQPSHNTTVEMAVQEPASTCISAAQQTHSLDKRPVRSWDFCAISKYVCLHHSNLLSCLGERHHGTLGHPSGTVRGGEGCCRLLQGYGDAVTAGEEQVLREEWEIITERDCVSSAVSRAKHLS